MNFRIVDVEPNSPAHFEFRKGKIGASMAATIMNENPWQTPLDLWEEIVFDKPRPKTKAMERGTEMEPVARKWLNSMWGVHYCPVVIQSLFYPDIIASLDGYYEKDGVRYLLEIKCPGSQHHQQALDGKIPEHYHAQLQHQMAIAGVDFMYYLSFDGTQGTVLTIHRNKEYCNLLLREELAFLQRIIDFKPPEPTDRDWVAINDPERLLMADRILELRLLKQEIENEETGLIEGLQMSLSHPRSKIGSLKAQKILRKGSIDYGKIEALKGIDLEPYRKAPISYWTFS